VKCLRLPARSPDLNSIAERFVLSIKSECLSKLVPLGERHLRRAVSEYVVHYHRERNHQGLGQPAACTSRTGGATGQQRRAGRVPRTAGRAAQLLLPARGMSPRSTSGTRRGIGEAPTAVSVRANAPTEFSQHREPPAPRRALSNSHLGGRIAQDRATTIAPPSLASGGSCLDSQSRSSSGISGNGVASDSVVLITTAYTVMMGGFR
jgi:hypothetical protein